MIRMNIGLGICHFLPLNVRIYVAKKSKEQVKTGIHDPVPCLGGRKILENGKFDNLEPLMVSGLISLWINK